MQPLTLYVEVPICAFRPHSSREYQDTYPVPPPASVYGLLLWRIRRGSRRGSDG